MGVIDYEGLVGLHNVKQVLNRGSEVNYHRRNMAIGLNTPQTEDIVVFCDCLSF